MKDALYSYFKKMISFNEKDIAGLVILLLFPFIFLIMILIVTSDYWIQKEYLRMNATEMKSIVKEKEDIKRFGGNKIFLKSGEIIIVNKDQFNQISIGDSVTKKQHSDSIIYHTSTGLFIIDEYKYQREQYLETLKK